MFPVVTLPARRFETVATTDGVRVIIDYAHHPTEIAAAIAMARETLSPGGRLLGVFQPHRYSRTKALGPAFPAAFSGLDALALAPVYAASEPPLPGGDTADLYAHCRAASSCGKALAPCFLPTLSSALPWLRFTARPGDTVLLIGAGDIISLVPRLCGTQRLGEPAQAQGSSFSSYGVGGPVHSLARVTDPADLPPLLASCRASGLPWRVIGAGTNLLVSDAGWEGVLIRLEGPAFQSLDIASDGTTRAGAGLPGARLLHEWTARGLSGLECMDGIPGTLGGWLAMNAGAQGHAIGDRLVSLTLLAPDGTVRTLPRADLDLSYRHASFCGTALASCVVLSATFAPLARTTPSAVEAARSAFRAKRFDFSGLRTAGSVFRNPPGDSAGRILDAAGLKGLRIGGAEVSPRHANIFVAHPGATASDLFALIRLAQLRSPVPLEPEITLL